MSASSSIRLLDTIEWTKKFNFLRRSALGNFLEPAKTSANTVLQTIVGAPFAWRWNRVVTGFITTPGQQDYFLLGSWTAATPVTAGWLLIDSNGNSQVVTSGGTTGGTIPSFGPTTGDITNDNDVVWTNLGPIGVTVSPTYSFAWMETVSVKEVIGTDSKWKVMETKMSLDLDSTPGRPRYVAAQADDGQGNITFRLSPVPTVAVPVAITLQKKPPLFTKLSQTWAPIPDEYSHIYNWGFMALMQLFADDPRWGLANQKFVAQLLSSNAGLTETERNVFLQNWGYITGDPAENASKLVQGIQARGA